jgi:hypothetical protein
MDSGDGEEMTAGENFWWGILFALLGLNILAAIAQVAPALVN